MSLPVEITLQINQAAAKTSLDPALVTALVYAESSGNTYAMRFEPAWKYFHFPREWASRIECSVQTENIAQATSWGLMQVMGSVARERGHAGWLSELSVVEVGLSYGCQHLKSFFEKYPTVEDAVSSYNQGSPRKTLGGLYCNQGYVSKVMGLYRQLCLLP